MSLKKEQMSIFTQIAPFKTGMGDDSGVTAHGYEDVEPVPLVEIVKTFCSLRWVLYVSDFKCNLLSVNVTDGLGFDAEFQYGCAGLREVVVSLRRESSEMGFIFLV